MNSYSLLKKMGKRQVQLSMIGSIIAILTSLGIIIAGIVELATFEYPTLTLLSIGLVLFAVSIFVFLIGPSPVLYKKVVSLYNAKSEKELIRIANRINPRAILALYALFDLGSEKAEPLLKQYLAQFNTKDIAGKLLAELARLNIDVKLKKKSSYPATKKKEIVIPITKAYFVNSPKELGKCMISKAQLTLDYEVVVCPYCSNMFKKELLGEWLKEKNTCPVCLTLMTIDDCPIVDIRDS